MTTDTLRYHILDPHGALAAAVRDSTQAVDVVYLYGVGAAIVDTVSGRTIWTMVQADYDDCEEEA